MLMMFTMLLQSVSREEQARRMELEARLQELTADRDHLKADRDTQRQTEATLTERLRMAEAMAHTNEQAITASVKELKGSLGAMQQAVQQAVKESTEHLLSGFSTLIDEKLGAMQSVTAQLEPVTEEPVTEEPVTEEPVTEAQPAQEVLPELGKKVRLLHTNTRLVVIVSKAFRSVCLMQRKHEDGDASGQVDRHEEA